MSPPRRPRWTAPRSLRVTPAGRVYLLLTLGVGFGALNTGNNLLYLVLGLFLSGVVASGVLSERCLRGLEVRRVGAELAFAQEPFSFRYELFATRAPAFALVLTEGNAGVEGEARVGHLRRGERRVVRGQLSAKRRGPYALQTLNVTTLFPLGLFAKTRSYSLDDLLLVYPRRTPDVLGAAAERHPGPLGDAGDPRRRDGTGDLLGLRELEPGEDARRVHWLKSASRGVWVKTERERERRRQFTLELSPAEPLETLERRCEEVAAKARRLLRDGHEVGLEAGEVRLRPAAGAPQEHRLLQALAWVGHEAAR